MPKSTQSYRCQNCSALHSKWQGQCSQCHEWNTLELVTSGPALPGAKRASTAAHQIVLQNLQTSCPDLVRLLSGIGEFDQVCGGGLVPGGVVLLAGEPGIGKSTLLLQVAAKVSARHPAYYLTGEEGVAQIQQRAVRLGLEQAPLQIASANRLADILALLETTSAGQLCIIDSIQTLYSDALDNAPGTVTQLRHCAAELIRVAKQRDCALLMVGHVTKEGQLAGPKILEHMVDTVLSFEGERSHAFRLLRTMKNRYGATDEIGVFDMTEDGLVEISNPSELLLTQRPHNIAGTSIFAGIEGSRPLLVEIQALVAPSVLATPRRTAIGWDHARLSMILAVLEARAGAVFGQRDVYLSVTGGLRIQDPAADLAVAAALLSALYDQALPEKSFFFGEIGLSGEIRAVRLAQNRAKEAQKLGFRRGFLSHQQKALRQGKKAKRNTEHLLTQSISGDEFVLQPLAHIRDIGFFLHKSARHDTQGDKVSV